MSKPRKTKKIRIDTDLVDDMEIDLMMLIARKYGRMEEDLLSYEIKQAIRCWLVIHELIHPMYELIPPMLNLVRSATKGKSTKDKSNKVGDG